MQIRFRIFSKYQDGIKRSKASQVDDCLLWVGGAVIFLWNRKHTRQSRAVQSDENSASLTAETQRQRHHRTAPNTAQ